MASQETATLIVDVQDLRTIVRHVGLDALMDQVIAELESAILEYDPSRFAIPARDGFDYSAPAVGLIEWMPAMRAGEQVTLKVVGYHPNNPATVGWPTLLSTVQSYDTRTGHLRGLVDGTLATALRTGAASAVASSILARPDATVLGLVGCGAQAVTQLHALSRQFDLKEVLFFDIERSTMESFPARIAALGLDEIALRPASTDCIVRKADILCTATSVGIGDGPVIRDLDVVPHLHINAVGSDFPGKVELPHSLLERALVCPDFTAQAVREGECQQLHRDQIGPDLPTLVKNAAAYSTTRDGLTVFDSTGWALEDHVVSNILIERARALGLGKAMQLEWAGADPFDPYDLVSDRAGHRRSRLAIVE